ncbi:hypothetical protein [Denitromonas ohlonensis]|uniref:EF-hand domain-containing protein n=2 Tax=Denitromonas TaxID=139331 RepID=A0A558EVH6_9RHOO|nr:hypothetical protein [Denitromonas ohlonensis]TVO64109.1 hypothetical protein FHP90_12420 [Denitromonas ohlonensis]TVO76010.1 hypothetical protein FHP89_11095 [Denitromonas ohlonensis]TVT77396.1 MAG: hypothetical protein FHP92_04280 [Denitromonas halophila]
MLVSLRPDRTGAAVASGIAALGFAGFQADGSFRLVALVLVVAAALFGWLRSIHHSRLILDTPTSRIASAAQGYTELFGQGMPLDGAPLYSPLNGLPVLWYRLVVDEKDGDSWRRFSDDESDASFLLDDGSGQCAVDPEGAELLITRKDVVIRDDRRYTQWCLIKQDPIYVIGDFTTLGSIDPAHDTARQVRDLLADWKADHPRLLERFDLDGDGQVDLQEWELARAEAKREVRRQQAELHAAAEAHIVRKPEGRRLYLISDLDPSQLGRRYQLWGWGFLVVLLVSAGLMVRLLAI